MEEPIKWLLIHATFRKPEVLISLCSVNQLATCPRNLQQSFIYLHWLRRKKFTRLHIQRLSWGDWPSTPDTEASLDLKTVIQPITITKRKVQCAPAIALRPRLLRGLILSLRQQNGIVSRGPSVLLDLAISMLSLDVEPLLAFARNSLPRGEARISCLHLPQSYCIW